MAGFKGMMIALGIVSAALVAAPTMAQDRHRDGHGGGGHGGHHPGRGHPGGGHHREEHHGGDRPGFGHDRPAYHRPPAYHGGYRPAYAHGGFRRWRRGERFDYRYARYYQRLPDWRRYHLYAPPRGYYWVRSGDDAVLVALAGGLIGAVIADRIH